MSELIASTIHDLHEKLAEREHTAGELCAAVFGRVGAVEDKVKAYLTLTEEKARAQASAADERIGAGRALGVLDGIPLGIKDVISTRGVRTTCGSKILDGFVPVYDAHVMELLESAGIVMTGKLNMDEFAMGSSCENSGFYPTHNPWDLDRVPGGSSGGSAAAVAAGECVAALGSDTGGSIRQPAALCGVVGMKPTYGLVSRYGLVAFASSLDQIGPLTRDVRDCALIMNAICGHDARDSTSIDTGIPDYTACLTGDVKGLKVGVPREFMAEGLEPGVRARVDEALKLLEGLGASIEECSLPHAEYALAAYYLIAPAEASSNLARYDGVRYGYRAAEPVDMLDMYGRTRDFGFGDEVKRRIMIGTYALSSGYYEAYYGRAQKVRTLIVRDFEAAFAKYDVLVSPTSPTVAFKLGERTGDPLAMYLSDICTIPVNLAGLPAISVPCGLADGLPVGLQIMGPALGEEAVLRSAHAFEQALGFDERPKL